MLTDTVSTREWEAAEIARSGIEARSTADAKLMADEAQVSRYLDPPLDTAFPLEYAYALLGDIRGKRVLDFGCGSGENSLLLARRGANVYGFDISLSLIDLATRRLEINGVGGGAHFVAGSAHDLPFPDDSVDVVFGIAILHHLDLRAASREVYRVLRRGGRAIFKEPVRDSRALRAMRRCIPFQAPDISPFERPLTTGELDAFSRPFKSFRSRPFSLPWVNLSDATPWLRRHSTAAYRWDARVLKRLPRLTPLAGIRVFEVTK